MPKSRSLTAIGQNRDGFIKSARSSEGRAGGFGHPNQQKLSNYNVGKRSEAPQRHLAGRVEAKRRGPLAEPLEVLERKRKERVDAVAPLRAEIAELRALNAATAALIA